VTLDDVERPNAAQAWRLQYGSTVQSHAGFYPQCGWEVLAVMFKLRFLVAAPAALALASIACSAEVGQGPESTGSAEAASSSCPSGSKDTQQRAAASAAYSIMKAASGYCASLGASAQGGMYGGPCFATTILTSHRYTLDSAGKTIIFDPSDVLYGNVPQAAKAALAFAQLDSSVASFLVGGLNWARANTNGLYVPVAMPIQALANFTYPGNSTPITIYDGAAGGNRRSEVVTGSPWCNTEDVHFADTSTYESGFAPFNVIQNTYANESMANFKGSSQYPTTPFNGSGGSANPYLVIAVNGTKIVWNTDGASWPSQSCGGQPVPCTGTIDIDPIPYTQPAAYYDANNNLVGPQANPFSLIITNNYADPSHAGQWATKTVNGVQQWGTFSSAVSIAGLTMYGYVKQL
jgi:hypothetical protein